MMISWFYAMNGKKFGPVTDDGIRQLHRDGVIDDSALLWQEGLAEWISYAKFIEMTGGALADSPFQGGDDLADAPTASGLSLAKGGGDASGSPSPAAICSECGRMYARDEMVPLGPGLVCADCKPLVMQKVREGVSLSGSMEYAEFWPRFGAKLLDSIILIAVLAPINIAMQVFMGVGSFALDSSASSPGTSGAGFGIIIIGTLINYAFQIIIPAIYTVWFIWKKGATPGKMAVGIRVVRSDGSPLTFGRAVGRHFATMLTDLTILIGYIIAAFDDERRALHDHICDTRVIRSR